MSVFAERLKQVMEQKHLKQADVIRMVEKVGEPEGIRIGKSHMSQYLAGDVYKRQEKRQPSICLLWENYLMRRLRSVRSCHWKK